MTFLVPVKVGDVISCYTKLLKVGNTSIQMEIEVWDSHDSSRPPVRVTKVYLPLLLLMSKAINVRFQRMLKKSSLASQSN